MAQHQDEHFELTYSAKDHEEIRRIRDKYLPADTEGNLETLRRLDREVTRKGTVAALILGILGTLIMGGGMSMAMVAGDDYFIPGILLGLLGIAVLAAAYPIYKVITRHERERIAPEILRLSEELMK